MSSGFIVVSLFSGDEVLEEEAEDEGVRSKQSGWAK